MKSNCARAAIAVFYLCTVVPGKVDGVTRNFFQEGQPPRKRSETMGLHMNNTVQQKKNLCSSGFFADLDYLLAAKFKSVFSFSLSRQVLEIRRYEL